MSNNVEYRIYPPLGVARLGDNDEYFLAPEGQEMVPTERGTNQAVTRFRDRNGRIRPQAVRFQVFKFEYGIGRELQSSDRIEITWNVELANKKAAKREEDKKALLELTGNNSHKLADVIDLLTRDQDSINHGRASIGPKDKSIAIAGSVDGKPMAKLYREGNNLLIHGASTDIGSFPGNKKVFDRTCDGKVTAKLTGLDGVELPEIYAWVVIAPPNYAPGFMPMLSLADLLMGGAWEAMGEPKDFRPSFRRHIFRHFRRAALEPTVRRWNSLNPTPATVQMDSAIGFPTIRELCYEGFPDVLIDKYMQWALEVGGATKREKAQVELKFYRQPKAKEFRAFVLNQWKNQWKNQRRNPELYFHKDWLDFSVMGPKSDTLRFDICLGAADQIAVHPINPGMEVGMALTYREAYKRDSVSLEPFDFQLSEDLQPGALTAGMDSPWQKDYISCGSNTGKTDSWPARVPRILFKDIEGNYSGFTNHSIIIPQHKSIQGKVPPSNAELYADFAWYEFREDSLDH